MKEIIEIKEIKEINKKGNNDYKKEINDNDEKNKKYGEKINAKKKLLSNNMYNRLYKNENKKEKDKEKVRNKSEILLRKNTLKELKECSFTPKIYKKEIKNDTSFILKNIEQINKYVRNRQEFLYKKQLIEIENEKKIF